MAAEFTKSALDRLGNRLRKTATPSPEDVAAYLQYRDEFTDALREVEEQLASLVPGSRASGRRKTLDTVVAKLKRQKTRLSTMQDIAGCRIVVPDLVEQDAAVREIQAAFDALRTDDLRETPHAGYRAVHVIVAASNGRQVEIQVRTQLQDIYAQLVEKMADTFGIEMKYGGGPEEARELLAPIAAQADGLDLVKKALWFLESREPESAKQRNEIGELRKLIDTNQGIYYSGVSSMIEELEKEP